MITIAIPTYNRGPILVETIELLLALTPPADEIVIVDQTKSYPSELEAKLQAFPIRWIRLPEPSIPQAMNVALREASNRIVLFLDDDVIPSPALVREHLRAHDTKPWAVAGQVLQPGQNPDHFDESQLHRGVLRDLAFRFNHDEPCDVENVMAGNLSVDREKALSIGGFDVHFTGAAYRFETDFARRVIAAGGRIRYEPRASLRHLQVPTGGVRAHGDPRRTASPAHSAGDYYFAFRHVPSFRRYALQRFRQNVFTRYTLAHPYVIPMKAISEIRGYLLARRMVRGE